MNWKNLVDTAKVLGEDSLPEILTEDLAEKEDFLLKMHNILFQFHVIEGALECQECKRQYLIKHGIPNLLLTDSEVTEN